MKLIDIFMADPLNFYTKEKSLKECCPYNIADNRYYPYKPCKDKLDDCEYRYVVNQDECDKCWNREYEEPPKFNWEELREIIQEWIKEKGITKEESRKILEEVRNSLRED